MKKHKRAAARAGKSAISGREQLGRLVCDQRPDPAFSTAIDPFRIVYGQDCNGHAGIGCERNELASSKRVMDRDLMSSKFTCDRNDVLSPSQEIHYSRLQESGGLNLRQMMSKLG